MHKFVKLVFVAISLFLSIQNTSYGAMKSYKKAVVDDEVVKNKLFPKKKKIELDADFGMVLNQSYLDSFVFHGTLNYFKDEEWGFGVEAVMFSNIDKSERTCIESFYNDSLKKLGRPCKGTEPEVLTNEDLKGSPEPGGQHKASYGPAYVPIRELNYIIAANAVWNPIYGKQLFFLKATGYFDLYTTFGGGIASSKFYPEEKEIFPGQQSRGDYPDDDTVDTPPGTTVGATDTYGIAGRPEYEEQTHPIFTVGVGQKYHFAKRFSFKIEIRNYTLLGTDSGFEPFFMMWGGFGMRL